MEALIVEAFLPAPEKLQQMCAVRWETVRKLSLLINARQSHVAAVLAFLHMNLTFEFADNVLKPLFRFGSMREVAENVFMRAWQFEVDTFIKHGVHRVGKLGPAVTAIVDGVPLYCRGPPEYFSGSKHHTKYETYLVWVDLNGTPTRWSGPFPGSAHESPCWAEGQKDLRHGEQDVILADLAYISCRHCLTKFKKPVNSQLTQRQQRFNDFHDHYRARVEHFFARLDKFRLLHSSAHYAKFNQMAMHFLLLAMNADDALAPKPRYDDVVKYPAVSCDCYCQFQNDTKERQVLSDWRETIATALHDTAFQHESKKSAKRARSPC